MNIIIVGGGKVGLALTELLSGEGHDVALIDTASKVVEAMVNDYDVIGYCGNGASFPVQRDAGVDRCDVFIAVTGSDELNIMSCLVAEKLGAKHSVARVRNPEYSLQMDFMRQKLGIDLVVNPDFEAASEIAKTIEIPAASKVETFAKGRIDLVEITITEDSPLCNLALFDIKKAVETPMLVCAVQREGEVIIPSGNFVLKAGDVVHFSAAKLKLSGVLKALGIQKKKIKSVLLIGGSRTAYYLAKYLEKTGIKVRLIEADAAKAAEIEAQLSGVSVICADGADTEILSEYGIEEADAVVSLTGKDEENIIVSMYAATRSVKKIICKVTRPALLSMIPTVLEDCTTVYPQDIIAGIILRYIRAVNNSQGSQIKTLYRILDGKAEAAEFIAAENCELIGVPLKQTKLKKNVIIACVSRQNTVIIPDGNTVINKGDSVIVITAGQAILDLNDILM